MIRGDVDEFLEVGFGFEEVINTRLGWLGAGTTNVLDDIALKVGEVLVSDKVPNLNGTLLVVLW